MRLEMMTSLLLLFDENCDENETLDNCQVSSINY